MSEVEHPKHYTSSHARCRACDRPIECIDVAEHMGFSLGNAMKYIWRAGLKGSAAEDLRKAAWYLQREIERLSPVVDASFIQDIVRLVEDERIEQTAVKKRSRR